MLFDYGSVSIIEKSGYSLSKQSFPRTVAVMGTPHHDFRPILRSAIEKLHGLTENGHVAKKKDVRYLRSLRPINFQRSHLERQVNPRTIVLIARGFVCRSNWVANHRHKQFLIILLFLKNRYCVVYDTRHARKNTKTKTRST